MRVLFPQPTSKCELFRMHATTRANFVLDRRSRSCFSNLSQSLAKIVSFFLFFLLLRPENPKSCKQGQTTLIFSLLCWAHVFWCVRSWALLLILVIVYTPEYTFYRKPQLAVLGICNLSRPLCCAFGTMAGRVRSCPRCTPRGLLWPSSAPSALEERCVIQVL